MKSSHPRARHGVRSTAISLAVLSLAASAAAQSTEPAPTRIEITGSIIKRFTDEGALPVTTVRSEDLQMRGHTELRDFMLELPQANSLGSFAGTAGPMTSLRGFGPMRTLTLLNGRRLAKEPLTNQYVSVNVMPRMAMTRTDILRDGASSAYGSDAVAGVQAFYTHRTFTGLTLKAEALIPRRDGGGDEQSIGAIAGIGDLARDGWNLYGALEVQKRKILLREDRPELIDGSALNLLGIPTIGQGTNAVPANFTDPTNPVAAQRTLRWNPYYGAGCLAPYSVPSTSGGRQTCFTNQNETFRAFGNGQDLFTLYGKGQLRLGEHTLSLEYNLAKFMVLQNNQSIPVTVRLTNTHPYYPGNGIVPTVPGLTLAGRPIDAQWSVADLGPREREDYHDNQRVVLALEGNLGGWDYVAGVNHGWSERETKAGRGWVSVTGVATVGATGTTLFLNPALNPFGLQDAAGMALFDAASLDGRTFRIHKGTNTSVDFTVNKELWALGGGNVLMAAGAEARRDGWQAVGLAINDPSAALNNQIDILGGDAQAAGANSTTSNKIHRDIYSAFAELEFPVTKTLSFNASVRADNYKDLGENTINPKVAFRWQPVKSFVLRGSANTGYRAPALPEIYSKETERTALATFNDPVLCVGGTPSAGYTAAQVCQMTNRFQITKVPSNAAVGPEKSKSFTLGFAVEPAQGLSASVDYWQTQIDDVIGNRGITFILNNPTLYEGLFRREADGTLSIDALVNTPTNLGALRGSGLDVSLAYAFQPVDGHRFNFGLDIAYLLKWEARSPEVNGGDWVSALGRYNDVVPVNPNAGLSNATRGFNNRWRHTASLGWAHGPWAGQLSHRYQSAFWDQNLAARTGAGTAGRRKVDTYDQFNVALVYSGIKNLKLGFAVQNLFDESPPLTNHDGYNGYLTSSVDVLGRAYRLTAEYKF